MTFLWVLLDKKKRMSIYVSVDGLFVIVVGCFDSSIRNGERSVLK